MNTCDHYNNVKAKAYVKSLKSVFATMRLQSLQLIWKPGLNKRRNQWGYETHISPIVHCGIHALEVANLNVVASNLLRTCFKSQSLPNSIIFITERHLHMFLTLCSQLKFTKIRQTKFLKKKCLNPTVDFKVPKYPIVFG